MDWKAKARYCVIVTDAPAHGIEYHDKELYDEYKNGDP